MILEQTLSPTGPRIPLYVLNAAWGSRLGLLAKPGAKNVLQNRLRPSRAPNPKVCPCTYSFGARCRTGTHRVLSPAMATSLTKGQLSAIENQLGEWPQRGLLLAANKTRDTVPAAGVRSNESASL
jgi:hypothetical protein